MKKANIQLPHLEEMYKCADDPNFTGLEMREFFRGNGYILLKDAIGQIYWRKIDLKEDKHD